MRLAVAPLLALSLCVGAARAEPEAAPSAPAAFTLGATASSELDTLVTSEVRRLGHPGMAVGIVVGDRVVVARGFGVRHRRTYDKVDASTVFRIASITKVFAGVALLQLRDDGKLALDDSIARFLPEANGLLYPTNDRPPVTIRQLFTHTSGLKRDMPSGGITERDLLQKLHWVKLEQTPGKHTAYSNFAMGLVGPIVRRASGEEFRDYMRAHVFQPLGMTSVAWEKRAVDAAHLALGHVKKDDQLDVDWGEWRMGAAEAFGGMYASLDDMTAFLKFELTAWSTGPELANAPLKRASLQESMTAALPYGSAGAPPEPQRYGVAWVLGDDDVTLGPRVEHGGATDEYSAAVVMFPKRRVGVVVLSNASYPVDVEAMARRIAKKAGDLTVQPANAPPAIDHATEQASAR